MKFLKNSTRIGGIIVMLMSIWSIISASSFGSVGVLGTTDVMGPRAWPTSLSAGMLVLSALLVIFGDKTTKVVAQEPCDESDKKNLKPVIVTCIAMVAYTFLLEPLGFLLVTPLFIFGLTLYFGGRPVISVLYAVGFTAILYLLFKVLLGILIPPIPFI